MQRNDKRLQIQIEAYDFSKAKSPLAKLKSFAQNIEVYSSSMIHRYRIKNDVATPQYKNTNGFKFKYVSNIAIQMLCDLKTLDAIDLAQALRAEGQNVSAKEILAYRDDLKQMPLSKQAEIYGDEQIYGTQGANVLQPLAGGGIAKIAGVDQGPPPERGPNSQGLLSLMKHGMKI